MKTVSRKRHIQQLVSLMVQWGIEHVVVCPGSRNAPLVHTIANVSGLQCHPVTDERSAGFVAIGISDSIGKPVAVCCTSGSAVLNIAPAVAEASYRHVPLLIISADRPKEWIGQMDGQTIVQPSCFCANAKSYSVEEPLDETQEWYVNRTINEALASLSYGDCQPVHINVHISEPLFEFDAMPLPVARKIHVCESLLALKDEITSSRRLMVIVGQMKAHIAQLFDVLPANSCVVLAENLSNLHNDNLIYNFDDILLGHSDNPELVPDTVIYLGDVIVSKRLKQFIRRVKPHNVIHVSSAEAIVDLFQSLTCSVRSTFVDALSQLSSLLPQCKSDNLYLESWKSLSSSAVNSEHLASWSDLFVVNQLIKHLPANSVLALANSSSVRLAQHFALPFDVSVVCNRGVNGIEGSLSSAVGTAIAAPSRLVFCIIGDLSFFYDMNALWNVSLPSNLRVLLLNNGGGSIFGGLRGLEQSEHQWPLVAAQHSQCAQGWVESTGSLYLSAVNVDDYSVKLAKLFNKDSRHPIVLEVMLPKCG